MRNMMFYRNVKFLIQRTGYATKTSTPTKRIPWTAQESDLLEKLVEKHGKSWTFLESFFEGRKANTLSSRYHNLEKKNMKKFWTPTEDTLLLSKVDEIGKDWDKIAIEFKGKYTKEEIKNRYSTARRVKKKSERYVYCNWSKLESYKMLILAEKYNKDWTKVSKEIGTRSSIQCANRYKRIIGTFNPHDEDNIELSKIQADKLLNAVQLYGLDFKTIKAKLHLTKFTPHELEQVYQTQLDPTLCQDKWTQKEMDLLVDLYNELDGHLKLVQTRLPKKRSLRDIWIHYVKATQSI